MAARTLAIMNQKGGVGKTTLAAHLGVGLAALGHRVTLIDMDPQGHLSVTFDAVGPDGLPRDGVFDLLVSGRSIDEVMLEIDEANYVAQAYKLNAGRIRLLPGRQRTQVAALDAQVRGADFNILSRAFQPFKDESDFILIDTAPTVALFTPAILAASDYVMVPTELNVLSFDGVENVMQTIINLQGMHNARVLSVLPVKVRPVGEHRQWLERLRENYPNILWEDVLLSHSVVWEESADAAQTIFTYAPSHKASEQAWALVRKFQRVVGND